MKIRFLLALILMSLIFMEGYSQCNQPFPPSPTCSGAEVVCALDGYCSSTGGANAANVPGPFCGYIENNQWIAFSAGSSSLSLYISVSNCSNQYGLQGQIFASNDCQNFTAVSNCWSPAYVTDGTINASGLTVGQTYYLMFDGWSVAQCDYTILVLSGTTGSGISAYAGPPASICPDNTLVLNGAGSSVGSNYSYQWTTTDGHIVGGGTSLSPTIDQAGTYTLEVTNTLYGCSNTSDVTITTSDVPVVEINALDELNCNQSIVSLSGLGSSEGNDYSYQWTTVDGHIVAGENTLIADVDQAGTYTLHITNQTSDCSETAAITIVEDFAVPDATASTDGTIGCNGAGVALSGQSSMPNVTYHWEGPNGFTSEEVEVMTFQAGAYTLKVTAANGCTATAVTFVEEDFEIPTIQTTGGLINCNQNSTQLFGSSSTPNVSYHWTGPNNFNSNEQNPLVFAGGSYTLVVSAPNGCEATATDFVIEDYDVPDGQATGGSLGCQQNSTTLVSNSNTANVSYTWTGPNNFFSSQQNPLVVDAGTYHLTITAPNGCEQVLTALVIEDNTPPDLSATGGTLTCVENTIELSATSTTLETTYDWIGPNNFTSSEQYPSITQAGLYTVTATAPNSCTTDASVIVTENTAAPDAHAVGGVIDCNHSSIQLNGSSTSPDVSYSWTGPNNFMSDEQNPAVQDGGIYTLMVTASNGCTQENNITVTEDFSPPVLSAEVSPLTCQDEVVQISSISNVTVDYSWTGPNNFSSTIAEPTVDIAGFYFLIATAANGCTEELTIEVITDNSPPDAIAMGGVLDCANDIVTLVAANPQANHTYHWTGPNNFSSEEAQADASMAGIYTLMVTATNGCSSTDTTLVSENFNLPDATAEGGVLTCNLAAVTLEGSSTVAGVSYEWTGPNGFYSEEAAPLAEAVGDYTLMIIAPNGCTNTAIASISEDVAAPTATAIGGNLTCADNTIVLEGHSDTEDATFYWTGPNGFEATEAQASTGVAGNYSLLVTAPNGCTATAETTVVANTDLPDIQANGNTLTCNSETAPLIGNSNTEGVTYHWTGPNNFSATTATIMASDTGTYLLTITAPNACAAVAEVQLHPPIIPEIALTGGALTCAQNSLVIQTETNANNATYQWTGPNDFLSNLAQPSVEVAGVYELTLSAENGCTDTETVMITTDTLAPNLLVNGGTVTCNETEIMLESLTDTENLTYSWTGPNNFSSNLSHPMVSSVGDYELTATAPNGCTTTLVTQVNQNQEVPNILAFDDTLNCQITQGILQIESSHETATYHWVGPNDFSSNSPQPEVNQAGLYIVTMTLENGCMAQDTASVAQDTAIPDLELVGGTISCAEPMVVISSSSMTENLTYHWTGPNNVESTESDISALVSGTYYLTVTAPNTCTQTSSIDIIADNNPPDISATGGTLDCLNNMVVLQGNSTTNEVTYLWTGPAGFESSLPNPTVMSAGDYLLTATASNGCTATATASVTPDANAPSLQVQGGEQTCLNENVQLTAITDDTNLSFDWSGPNNFSSEAQHPMVNQDGIYNLTVTAPNGCTATASGVVSPATVPSIVISSSNALTCTQPVAQLLTESATAGLQYAWSGPNNYQSAQANPSVNSSGTYYLTVTAANGCTASDSLILVSDTSSPDLTAIGGSLTCTAPELALTANSTTPDVSYDWTGPNNFSSNLSNPVVSLAGSYQVLVTAANGCQRDTIISVVDEMQAPDLILSNFSINCEQASVALNATTETADISYFWEGPNGWTSEESTPVVELTGQYSLSITAPNGCVNTQTLDVVADTIAPVVSLEAGSLTCAITSTTINSTSDALTYNWTGPAAFEAIVPNPIVHQAGLYQVITTAANGCSTIASIEILADITPPTAFAGADDFLDCQHQSIQLDGTASSMGAIFRPTWFTTDGSILNGQQGFQPTVDQAGIYILEMANTENGCVATDTVVVTEAEGILRFAFYEVNKPSCFDSSDGMLLIDSVVGGVAPLSFSLDGVNFSAQTVFDGLPASLYDLTVRDAAGCEWATEAEIDAPFRWTVELGQDQAIEETGAFRLEPVLSIIEFPVVDILWTPSEGLSCTDCLTPLVLPTATTTYTLSLTNSNGCTISDDVTVTVGPGENIYIPTAFSPDDNGDNDRLTVYAGHGIQQVISMDLFDSYGRPVYQAKNFAPNDEAMGWDGNFKGQALNSGVFVYVVQVEMSDGRIELLRGDFNLIR